MAEIINASQAAMLVTDGATLGFGGMGLSGWPEEIAVAIAERFKTTGHPKDLSLKQGSAMGDWKERGITRLGVEGMVSKWSAAHIGSAFALNDLVQKDKIACHCLPQGVIVNLWREIAAHRPGLITKVGLGTFVDPRIEGGKMNKSTTEELVEVVNFSGEEYLFYKGFKLDFAFLRGTVADENGNITFEKEGSINEGLAIAQAAKNSGGKVIVQVEYLAKKGSLHPKDVKIPGVFVDYIVVATDLNACWQTEGQYYEPSFAGNIKKPIMELPVLPLNDKKIIARRAAMEVEKGDIVNLGVGIPADVASVISEAGYSERITLTTEVGGIGGVPASSPNFGNSYNAEAIIDHGSMFDFYDGGGIDVAVLGLAQADAEGNINVSKFGNRLTGPGGFINITQSSKKVIFAGTFNAKAKIDIIDGKVVIINEGTGRKFIEKVQQITFSGKYKSSDEVKYITERCVFELINGEMQLTEIAPGIDMEKDILEQMDFKPVVSQRIKQMDESIFYEKWNGLEEILN